MSKRFKAKKKINLNIIAFFIIFIIILILISLKVIGDKMAPGIYNYAEKEATKLMTIIVRKSISKDIIKNIDSNELFIKNDKTVDINSVLINNYLNDITINIQKNLKYLEEGDIEKLDIDNILASYDKDNLKKGIYAMMPIGVVFNNPLLINLSPKIPLKMYIIGNAKTKINSKVTSYGINNALIEIILYVEINTQVLMPIRSKEVKVELEYPIITKIIEGTTPNYWGGFITKTE